jgi:endonuclease-3 related protein
LSAVEVPGEKRRKSGDYKEDTFIKTQEKLLDVYDRLYRTFGPRHWWPADSVIEMIIGAILVQNVSWKNTETALFNLKKRDLLCLDALNRVSAEILESQIRSTRYYRIKAKKLKAFASFVTEKYRGNLEELLSLPLSRLREELLKIYGIGEETADSIILYGSRQPIFVVDAYTRRIFHRLGFISENSSYRMMQDFFMKHLPVDTVLYNEYHALIDCLGNRLCSNKKPGCVQCPLQDICRYPKSQAN